jgi:hypothetical protein
MRRGAHLHLITGKGGTGRTTTALALGLAWAARGASVLVVELGADGGLARTLGLPPLAHRREIARYCEIESLAPEPALDRFLEARLPSRRVAATAQRSQVLRALFHAAPGTVEVAQLDALARATSLFDRVVVDGEASGQTLAMLETPEVFGGLGARGLVGERLVALGRGLRGGTWSALVTTLARPFIVAETRTLLAGLDARGLGARVVVTGPAPSGVSASAARSAHLLAAGTPAEEDLEFLAALAAQEEGALHALPNAIDLRGPRPSDRRALTELGTRLLLAMEAA